MERVESSMENHKISSDKVKVSSMMEILCSICCCSLIDPKQEIGLPFSSSDSNRSNEALSSVCGHIFHKFCILKWQQRSKNCPECRAVIHEEDFHKVFFNVNFKSDEDHQEDADEERTILKRRNQTLTKCIKQLTKELGHIELKCDKLEQATADKDHEINILKSMLNRERLSVPLRRVTLK